MRALIVHTSGAVLGNWSVIMPKSKPFHLHNGFVLQVASSEFLQSLITGTTKFYDYKCVQTWELTLGISNLTIPKNYGGLN